MGKNVQSAATSQMYLAARRSMPTHTLAVAMGTNMQSVMTSEMHPTARRSITFTVAKVEAGQLLDILPTALMSGVRPCRLYVSCGRTPLTS